MAVAEFFLAASAAAQPPATEALYLQAFLNGIDRELIVRVDRQGELFLIAAEELEAIGVKLDGVTLDADGRTGLHEIPNLEYRYDPLNQSINLTLPSASLLPQILSYESEFSEPPRADLGVALNYTLNVQSERPSLDERAGRKLMPLESSGYGRMPIYRSDEFEQAHEERNQSVAIDTDLRLFSRAGLFVNHITTTRQSGETASIRNDSYWNYTSIEPLRSYAVGDYISSSLSWTRALRLGGARVARNFDVRPDLITFPLPTLGGTAVVPTTVDLYVNGMRQFSGAARPGPFVITEPPALTGAGDLAIVYRDALGREVTTTQPFYVDSRLLGDGLHDYAFEWGYPRRNYGSSSSDYADEAAGAASLRYGITDAFTLEAHAETGELLENGGIGGLYRLGRYGVLSASFAVSDAQTDEVTGTAGGRGKQTSAGYQYITPRWSFDIYDRRTDGDYRDLGSFEGVPVQKRFSRAGISVWFAASHAVTLNYTRQEEADLSSSRLVTLGYNASWRLSRISTFVNVFHDRDNPDSDGAYVSVTASFGNRSDTIYSSASESGDERTVVLGTSRPVDYDRGGFGWGMRMERGNEDYSRDTANLDYRGRFGEWSLLVEEGGAAGSDNTNTSLYGSGSLVYMQREFFATRAIYDGFAVVSTQGAADVPVLRENRLLGSTNKDGYLLVPDLPSYRTSRIAIDTLNLPVDASVSTDRLAANPRERSGVLVEFPIDRFRGATLILVDEQGEPLRPGTRITLLGTNESALLGFDGQVFFPELQPVNRVSAETNAGSCVAEISFAPEQSMAVLGPFVCAVSP